MIGVGTKRLLKRKVPPAGAIVGQYYVQLERRLLRESSAVVSISEDFLPQLERCGVSPSRVVTIENWAPLSELPVQSKDNAWARAHGLDECFVFLYMGTLARKHNPDLLAAVADHFRERPEVRIVVLSQGLGADYLRVQRKNRRLTNLIVMDYQSWDSVPEVMATADVLVAVLERGAGTFSVPSKVLSYLCASRPLLGAIPRENLAARIVERAGAGLIVDPGDTSGFVGSAHHLLDAPETRARMAKSGREFAERTFDIERITDRFESVIEPLAQRPGGAAP
jgi:glycosyltransferase involved in cell wall biosynthesis